MMKIQDHLSEDFIDKLYKSVIQSQKKYKSHHVSKEEMDVKKHKGLEDLMGKNRQIHERRKGAMRRKR